MVEGEIMHFDLWQFRWDKFSPLHPILIDFNFTKGEVFHQGMLINDNPVYPPPCFNCISKILVSSFTQTDYIAIPEILLGLF